MSKTILEILNMTSKYFERRYVTYKPCSYYHCTMYSDIPCGVFIAPVGNLFHTNYLDYDKKGLKNLNHFQEKFLKIKIWEF